MRNNINRQLSIFCQWSDHKFSEELRKVSEILDEYPEFADWVLSDLLVDRAGVDTGARGMSADQVLRAAILKQQNGWTYEFLELQMVDSDMSKSFVRLDFGESYSASTLQENIAKIRAETWQRINDTIIGYARDVGVESGRTVRMDATVVESNIHPPSDSSLLYDCIRVANRVFKLFRSKFSTNLYPKASAKKAKNLMLGIINAGDDRQRRRYYKKLLKLADALLSQLANAVKGFGELDCFGLFSRQVDELKNLQNYLPIIIRQTRSRIFKGTHLPPDEKVVSIFEPHTDIISKGRRKTEFGHKVFLTSGASGLVTDCQLVQGAPKDSDLFIDLIERQIDLYGKAPRQTSADGCFASIDNVEDAKELGVNDVCFSKTCGIEITDMVKSEWVFQKLRNFRAGIEGTISCLKRAFGLSRVTWRGVQGFAAYIHSAVVAYNLTMLARTLI